jgi:hypothetical protein
MPTNSRIVIATVVMDAAAGRCLGESGRRARRPVKARSQGEAGDAAKKMRFLGKAGQGGGELPPHARRLKGPATRRGKTPATAKVSSRPT